MDRFQALEVFRAVAREGSMVGAARKLSLSPPSVTRIINELETHLGTPLLRRSTRAIHLTETGQHYLTDAERILDDLQAAEDAAQGARRDPSGTLRLTSSVLFGQHYITPIIGEYLARYPDVRVDAAFLDRTVNLIEEGFDLAIRIGALADSSLRAIRVGAVRMAICGAPAYFERRGIPQTPADLARHDVIQFRGAGFAPDGWTLDGGTTVNFAPRAIFSNVASCLAMACAGQGITRALTYQIAPFTQTGALRTVLDDHSAQDWPIHLLHAERHGQSAKLRAFLDIAVARLRADPRLR